MNISIITVGKLKEKYLKQGIDEYLKRLSAYAKIEIIEVPDEKAPEELSETEMLQVKQKEGERILSKIHPDAHERTIKYVNITGQLLCYPKGNGICQWSYYRPA